MSPGDLPAHWRERAEGLTADTEQNVRPLMERMLADGTIESWGNEVRIVHEENGTTHGTWWAATSIAGLERVLEELAKLPPNSALDNAGHHDHLMESIFHRGKTTALTSGYLFVEIQKVQPGVGLAWRQLWEKYYKPTFDELLDNGTILSYQASSQYVHTEDPRWRYVWTVTPNAEAEDKVEAAINALFEKDGTAIRAAFNSVQIGVSTGMSSDECSTTHIGRVSY